MRKNLHVGGYTSLALLIPSILLFPAISVVGALMEDVPQELRSSKRRFRLKFERFENTKVVRGLDLWVTRDGGETWNPAARGGVEFSWGTYLNGRIPCTVRVPEDGEYGFHPIFGDGITNVTKAPRSGDPATLIVIVNKRRGDTGGKISGPRWLQPSEGDKLAAKSPTVLSWAVPNSYRQKTVALYSSLGGGRWEKIDGRLPRRGKLTWDNPGGVGALLKLRLTVQDGGGETVEDTVGPFWLRSGIVDSKSEPHWLQPHEGDELMSAAHVTLRWNVPDEGYKKDSVSIYASIDGNPWKNQASALPLSGKLDWMTPALESAKVRFRAEVHTVEGKEAFFYLGPILVREGLSAAAPKWIQPRGGDTLAAGSIYILRWEGQPEYHMPGTIMLYASWDKGAWTPIVDGQTAKGSYPWRLPVARGERLRLKVAARTPKGVEVFAVSGEIKVRGGLRSSQPRLLSPQGGERWMAGDTVRVRWTAGDGIWMDHSTKIEYSLPQGPWRQIAAEKENTDFHLWAVPTWETEGMRIRVVTRTLDGTRIASAPSGNIWVVPPFRVDLRAAMGHYDRARVLHGELRTAEAVAEYKKALDAWSTFPDALNELGLLYYQEGEPARALEYFLKARKASPARPRPYLNSAIARIELGLLAEGFQDLKDAVDLGVDRDRVLAVTCAEKLMVLAVKFNVAERVEMAIEACQVILRVRHADARIRKEAKAYLESTLEESKTP